MTKRIRMTKKREEILRIAITVDDLLYEKFRHMKEEVDREWARLGRAKHITRVVQKRKDNCYYEMPILEVLPSRGGTMVVVG